MTAHIYAMTDTWNDPAVVWRGDAMNIVDTGHAAGSTVMRRSVNDNQIFALGPNGHAAIGKDAQIDNDPNWIGQQPILLELSETLATFGVGTYGLVLTHQFDLTEDTGHGAVGAAITVYVASSVTPNLTGSLVAAQFNAEADNSGNIDSIYSMNGGVTKRNGSVTNIYNTDVAVRLVNASASFAYGYKAQFYFEGDDPNVAHADTVYGFTPAIDSFGTWTATNFFGFWSPSLAAFSANITNPYYWWTDGPGVTRIKEEGVIKGGVYAWYNPNFTKYTAGAPNAERGVLQWAAGDIVEVGAEAIGTGTLRKLRLLQNGLLVPNTPTADPHVAGQVWANSGVLTLSAG